MIKKLHIRISPHPFAHELICKTVETEGNLMDAIDSLGAIFPPALQARITSGGKALPIEDWETHVPQDGEIISVNIIPQDGGGEKDPVRTITTIALISAAITVAPYLLPAGLTGFGATLFSTAITGGITYAGMQFLDTVFPPPSPDAPADQAEDSQRFGIEGSRNRLNPYGAIPQVLGQFRMMAFYAAQPYTEVVGPDQFLRMLFTFGYGPLNFTDLKLGDTGIESYEGVEYNYFSVFDPDVDSLELYVNTVEEESLNIKLEEPDEFDVIQYESRLINDVEEITVDVTAPQGVFGLASDASRIDARVTFVVQFKDNDDVGADWSLGVVKEPIDATNVSVPPSSGGAGLIVEYKRTDLIYLNANTGEVVLKEGEEAYSYRSLAEGQPPPEVTFPAPPAAPDYGLPIARVYVLSSGIIDLQDARDVSLTGFEATIADSATVDIASGELGFEEIIFSRRMGLIRRSVRLSLPALGNYLVRVGRTNAEGGTSVTDDIYWTAVRGIKYERPINKAGMSLLEIRIKATDQLNGLIEDLNAVVTSQVLGYNGSSGWVEDTPSSNPADLFRHVLQGAANQRPLLDTEINLTQLEEWWEYCVEESWSFNQILDTEGSLLQTLRRIASAGRASVDYKDGKYSVIIDELQTVPIQHLSPRNSFAFGGTRNYTEKPHAFKVRFPNAETRWESDEIIVYDDGFDASNATRFEVLDLPGITYADTAWRIGRYHIAQLRLRPETYKFDVDVENLVCTRGDLILLNHDVPLFGLGSGRILEVIYDSGGDITQVVLDQEVAMEAGKTYGVRFRLIDGTSLSSVVLTVDTLGTDILTFLNPLDGSSAADIPETGDLFMFGLLGSESVPLIIKSIAPKEDLIATIEAVDQAVAIYDADTGEIPTYVSNITQPFALLIPEIEEAVSDESVLTFDLRNNPIIRILIKFLKSGDLRTYQIEYLEGQYRASGNTEDPEAGGAWTLLPVIAADAEETSIYEVEEGLKYDIRFRFKYRDGRVSLWATVNAHQVVGLSTIPSDVEGFTQNVSESTAYLKWNSVPDRDLSHYELRYSVSRVSASWESSSLLVERIPGNSTSVSINALSGTYLIKAVDLAGNKSANATALLSNVQIVLGLNEVLLSTENPDFRGYRVGTSKANGILKLSGGDTLGDWPALSEIDSLAMGDRIGFVNEGFYYFEELVDLGAVYQNKLLPSLSVTGGSYKNRIGDWPAMNLMATMTGAADNSQWDAIVELRYTDLIPNYCLAPLDLTALGWVLGSSGGGTDPVVISDNALGPDNSTLYDKVEFGSPVSFINYVTGITRPGKKIKLRYRAKSSVEGTLDVGVFAVGGTLHSIQQIIKKEWRWFEQEADIDILDTGEIKIKFSHDGDSSSTDHIWIGDIMIFIEDEWTEWTELILSDYRARGFEYRIRLTSSMYNVTPEVSELEIETDMPDRVDGEDNIATDVSGLKDVVFNPAFKETPAIAITGRDTETGDYFQVTNQTRTGFRVNFFDSTDSGVLRNFDWVAKGFGHVQG